MEETSSLHQPWAVLETILTILQTFERKEIWLQGDIGLAWGSLEES